MAGIGARAQYQIENVLLASHDRLGQIAVVLVKRRTLARVLLAEVDDPDERLNQLHCRRSIFSVGQHKRVHGQVALRSCGQVGDWVV